jgi:hypothetical protein
LRGFVKQALLGSPGKRLPWHPLWRAERLIRGLGAIEVLGIRRIADEYGIATQSGGTPLAATDIRLGRLAHDVVAGLAARVMAGERALLILEHGADGSGESVSVAERLATLAAVDRGFRIRSAQALVTPLEARVSACHRRLAADTHLESPRNIFRLLINSLVAALHLTIVNMLARNLWIVAASSEAAVLLLDLERRDA